MQKTINPLLAIKRLSVRYGNQLALNNISLEIQRGDFIGLAGPNGAGKTSLVRAMVAAYRQQTTPQQTGKIIYNNLGDTKLGYLPQQHHRMGHFPVDGGEVVLLGLLANKKNPKVINQTDKDKVETILASLNISHLQERGFYSLSGGQKQLFLLARALVAGNNFFIFDEPTTALAANARRHFLDLIIHLNQQHQATIIFITHDIGDIKNHANKIIYLDRDIKFFGKTKDFVSSHWAQPANNIDCHDHP